MRILEQTAVPRSVWSEELLDRLTPLMSALGVLFLLVVLSEVLVTPGTRLAWALAVVGWLLWAAFAAEFAVRLYVAPDRTAFLRRNWWQLAFLVLPFLRFLRLFHSLRMLRTGRVLSSAVRSSRSTRQVLGGRLTWLGVVTGITVMSGSQLLYQLGDYERYADALHATALAAIAGEPLAHAHGWTAVIELGLVVFSVVVFAALAGALGAFFLGRTERP